MAVCGHCTERPTPPGRTLCQPCEATTTTALGTIRDLADELDSVRARERAVVYTGAGGQARETPLPYDTRVTPVEDAVRAAVHATAATVWEYHQNPIDDYDPASTTSTAGWLVGYVPWLATIDDGPDLARDLTRAADKLSKLLDVSPDRLYLGPCDGETTDPDGKTKVCTAEVFVTAEHIDPDDPTSPLVPAAAEVTCRSCKGRHDVGARRAWYAQQLAGHLATIRQIAGLFAGRITRSQVYDLERQNLIAARGQVAERTKNNATRLANVYAIGEVLDAHERRQEDKAARTARAASTSRTTTEETP